MNNYAVTCTMLFCLSTLGSLAQNPELDTLFITEHDSVYYRTDSFDLITADGKRVGKSETKWFRDENKEAYYIIHRGNPAKPIFEGIIKPGNNYHGRCIMYYVHSDKAKHLASETDYMNGKKHGLETHYERDGSINWQKKWEFGEQKSILYDNDR